MTTEKGLYTTRAILLFTVYCALCIFPFTGIIMMFLPAIVGPAIGLFPHLIILALICDIYRKELPRSLLIVPILIYAGYYGLYIKQFLEIKYLEKSFQASNPNEIPNINIKDFALVTDQISASDYKIPVVYSGNENYPDGYLSSRLVSSKKCAPLSELEQKVDGLYVWGVHYTIGKKILDYLFLKECQLNVPEKPTKKILKVTTFQTGSIKRESLRLKLMGVRFEIGKLPFKTLVEKTVYLFTTDSKELGRFTGVRTTRLPVFPLYAVGCGLNDASSSWDCFAGLAEETKTLNTFPAKVKPDLYNHNPVAAMLKIEKYKENDVDAANKLNNAQLDNFKDYPENEVFIDNLINKIKNEKPEDFNKWGVRKDSLYHSEIGKQGNIDSFRGIVYGGDKGGEFYDFIKMHQDRIVYLDIDAKPNASHHSFENYGVCKARENCTGRTDDSYQFFNESGERREFSEEGKFKGVFRVGKSENFTIPSNQGDNDTITKLIFLRLDP